MELDGLKQCALSGHGKFEVERFAQAQVEQIFKLQLVVFGFSEEGIARWEQALRLSWMS